jgi:poly-gamma-glutamate synthesis protein (capsule biosynthesis protein)
VWIAGTGDVLLHPPLVDQARADSPDGQGLNFTPMLTAPTPYIGGADLGICHLETPLASADGPFLGYPEFSVPPQVLPALVAGTTRAAPWIRAPPGCPARWTSWTGRGRPGPRRLLPHPADAATPTLLTTSTGTVALISATYGFNTDPRTRRGR